MNSTLPQVLASEIAGNRARLHFKIGRDIEYFQGHFDSFAILPGVAQISWVIHYSKEYFEVDGNARGLDNIKFLKPIEPDSRVWLELNYNREKQVVDFEFIASDLNEKVSMGRILLEAGRI